MKMMNSSSSVQEFNVVDEINSKFYDVWTTSKPYNVLKGGRSSFKSSVIALKLVFMMYLFIAKGKKANVIVVRKTANTIRDSVYRKVQWAIEKIGILDDWEIGLSTFVIKHRGTGSTFHFYGASDFDRLKSNDINDLIAVWYEEAAEFKSVEEFDQMFATFARQKNELARYVYFFWSYNPPRNPYSWINEWADERRGDDRYLLHESSYLDDELGLLTDQMLEEIETIKANDYDYYRYLYLGEAVGLGTNIYNMNLFNLINELPDDDPIIDVAYSADIGHQTSATAVLCFAITAKNNVILLDTWYYSPQGQVNKKAPSQLSKEIHDFIAAKGYAVYKYTIDSAEGGFRNQYQLDYGTMWRGVAKQRNHIMIDHTHALLAQGRVYVLNNKNNQIFLEQAKRYEWDEKTVHTDAPKPVGEEDHSVDAFIYFVVDNLRRLALRR